jgi:hypothetical protein
MAVSSSGSMRRHPSKRVWADDFPAVTLQELLALRVIHRTATIQEFLDVAAVGGRRVETSSPIRKVISPVRIQATSSLSRC